MAYKKAYPKNMDRKKACVIGCPIGHSLSPRIHTYWLKQYNIDGEYSKVEVKPESLVEFLENMEKQGYSGCNVTIPHKENVKAYLEESYHIGAAPQYIGAVNTVQVHDTGLYGLNTDHYGFIASLKQGIGIEDISKKKVLVLGAGGAARGIIYGLINESVESIIVTNRTREKAEKIAEEMSPDNIFVDADPEYTYSYVIEVIDWERKDADLTDIDIVVNTTSLGMVGQPPLEINLDGLKAGSVVTDIVFNPLYTDLLLQAQEKGYRIVDGLGMLLHQAAPGFKIFFDRDNVVLEGYPEVTDALRNYVLEGLD